MPDVVYEDNHMLVVEKPPNLLVQGDATGDDCLLNQMKEYIAEKYHKPGAVYLGLVHRMDRPVGGLLVFARTGKAAARLSAQLRVHGMQREYLAVVHGCLTEPSGELRDFLLKGDMQVQVVPEGTDGAQEAILHYSLLAQNKEDNTALLHIQLKTGRKHQIRVQLAHSGHPIVQDMRYGQGKPGEPIALWGVVLTLEHPTLKTRMRFTSLPKGRAFQPFQTEISAFFDRLDQIHPPQKGTP